MLHTKLSKLKNINLTELKPKDKPVKDDQTLY